MKVFFDTEFTGLHKDTTLISIGLIDENGRCFYAELNDYDKHQCDDWIRENVISNLNSINPISKEQLKERLAEWFSVYDNVELVSDVCHYDMVLFIDIFGSAFDLPDNIAPACYDINQDISRFFGVNIREAFDVSREDLVRNIKIPYRKHNALYDAIIIKEIYNNIFTHHGVEICDLETPCKKSL